MIDHRQQIGADIEWVLWLLGMQWMVHMFGLGILFKYGPIKWDIQGCLVITTTGASMILKTTFICLVTTYSWKNLEYFD
jgi:hypothetical protein